ncbi:MAG TPA: hypothetical protein VLM41_11125, partial [Steroidobacteraceae bacterium]|nr:hypothetical protein [Steroidobacteraceae bacterium]
PVSRLQYLRQASGLVRLNTDFDLPSTGYGIVQLQGRNPSPAAVAFMQLLREEEAEEQAAPRGKSATPDRPTKRPRARAPADG